MVNEGLSERRGCPRVGWTAAQVSISLQMGKENVACSYHGILLHHEKEWNASQPTTQILGGMYTE